MVSANAPWHNLPDVARDLQLPEDTVTVLDVKLTLGTSTPYSVLYEMLEKWLSIRPAEAKLQTLLNFLKKNGLDDCASKYKFKNVVAFTFKSLCSPPINTCHKNYGNCFRTISIICGKKYLSK